MGTKDDNPSGSSRTIQIAIVICAIVEAIVLAGFIYSKLKH